MISPWEHTSRAFNLEGVSILLATPVHSDHDWRITRSIVDTLVWLKDTGVPCDFQWTTGCSILPMARNKIALEFLKSNHSHLFMYDSDVAWTAEGFKRLVALSTINDVIVGAYPAKKDPPTFMMGLEDQTEFAMNDYGCFVIPGLGLGYCMVSRDVMEDLAKMAPQVRMHGDKEPKPMIFRYGLSADGEFMGEDIAFFCDVRKAGYEVWLDPNIELEHVGVKAYGGSILDGMQKVQPCEVK